MFFFFCINNSLGSVNKKKKDAPLKDVPHELLEKIEKRQIELFVEFFCFTNPSLNIFISFKFSRIKLKLNEKKL